VITDVVAIGFVWLWLYEPNNGLFNSTLKTLGVHGPAWLSDTRTALIAVIIVAIWHGVGYPMVILLAGLQAIDQSLTEAATVDGASAWRRFWAVTFPLLTLGTGKVAMLLALTSGIPYLRKNAKVKWDIFPPPMKVARKTVNTMTVLAVPKASKDPDAAWDFLKYCVGPDASKLLAESRGSCRSARARHRSSCRTTRARPISRSSQALDNAVNENFGRYIERARTIYRPVLDNVWSGKQSAAAALGGVKQKVEDVLAGKG
jgi:multiple sugar transport system substrate-binding protein